MLETKGNQAKLMDLSPNEIRDVTRLLEQGKPLPDKYRFLLFGDKRQVELVWNGKTDEVTNVVLPFQSIEHIDEPRTEAEIVRAQQSLLDMSGRQIKGWTNKLIWGDNKLILSALKNGPMRKEIEDAGGIKLIYIDPPFDVGADFSMNIEVGDEEFTKKPSVIEEIAYRDTWGKGADSFIAMIYERLKLMHGLLAEDGSIYVHCDWRVSAYVKLALDEIFGIDNFQNEIIWAYEGSSRPRKAWDKKHETILMYSKSEKVIFNAAAVGDQKKESSMKAYEANMMEDEGGKFILRYRGGGGFAPKELLTNSDVYKSYMKDFIHPKDWWHIDFARKSELVGYPTQKPLTLIERIINASSVEGDLVADFFVGSGTTLSVAEKLGRKWIGTDIGRFGIHTARKRMIEVQRSLKKEGKNYHAFEILNLGKYERKQFVNIENDLRAEEKEMVRRKKEGDFKTLILSAYKAEPLDGFRSFVGKKRDRLVAVGPIEYPVSYMFIQEIIQECQEKMITKADVLGFDYEMGTDFSDAKKLGIDLQFKVIPNEVFDKRAVERGQVKFFDVAFIEVKPVIKKNAVAIELSNFSVFYNQDDINQVEQELRGGSTKIILENGNIIKLSKDKETDLITREVLTQKWSDWIDYWAVDFNYESRKEIIRDEKGEEGWTGQYVFENEWQSFRTRKGRELELTSAFHECAKGRRKIAVKVIDIFGNDTTKIIEVNV